MHANLCAVTGHRPVQILFVQIVQYEYNNNISVDEYMGTVNRNVSRFQVAILSYISLIRLRLMYRNPIKTNLQAHQKAYTSLSPIKAPQTMLQITQQGCNFIETMLMHLKHVGSVRSGREGKFKLTSAPIAFRK